MTLRLVTADHVAAAAEQTLRDQIPTLIASLGWDVDATDPEAPEADPLFPRPAKKLTAPKAWDQVPTLDALTTATFPAGAITSPGLTNPPTKKGWDRYDATWRLSVAVYDRGGSYDDTASRVRSWAALIRAALALNPGLNGLSQSLIWVGEEYRLLPQKGAARTIGGCAVAVDVTVENVMNFAAGPLATSVHSSLTVTPTQE